MLWFFFFFFVKIGKVNGGVCEEDLGECDGNCDLKCQTLKNGKGVCDSNEICKCVYECEGPGSKRCNVGIGPCSLSCRDDCCGQNCASKFPGAQDGHGYCMYFAASNQCLRYFNC